MKRDKLYISRPALVTACGIGMEPLWKQLSTADNSAIRPMRSTFGGREFYAATVDDGLLSPVPAPHDTHIMRLAQTALAELDPTLQRALSLYGSGRIGACVGGCDNGSERSIQAHKS
ncbi:MAG: 3-oxoacyl-ACP synthase, partial [Treponema sp.]|nr:3-oxoacyl-ACP synthase [Treponema sp.]